MIFFGNSSAQKTSERKVFQVSRITSEPEIDGIFNEDIWRNLPSAENFVMVEPGDGKSIPASHDTKVQIAYNDEAIFFAVRLLENEPNELVKQFTQRDNLQQSDFFSIDLNTYDDGENQTRFIVTAAGTQADAKMTGDREDYSYNVVWESAVSRDDDGWYLEIKIPYAALRFPEAKQQLWGVQFSRKITHLNETYVWNYIDKSVGQASQYTGLLTGIENIDPPVRLSFYPYLSSAVDYFDVDTQFNFSAGMDLKYGINESFTLDMTLVPDFGQTAYDEVELNLGPFEQIFGENRAFFTEGTELFTKGNLFYSRRIGNAPIGFNNAQDATLENERVLENPSRTDLLNALKISGRTQSGLGVGFFNAVTNSAEASILDTITGIQRKIKTEPLANYNILVLDQRFNKNSSISLVNTNVTRDGHFRDANVSAFLFDIFNKKNSYNFSGQATMSNVNFPQQNITGFASELEIERTKGNIRYGLEHEFANETYNINDLGISQINNFNNISAYTSYQIFEPQGIFNFYRIEVYGQHLRRYKPDIMVNTGMGGGFFAFTASRFAFGGNIDVNSKFRDFFETRTANRYITYKPSTFARGFVSSDYRNPFAYDIKAEYQHYFNSEYKEYELNIEPRFRFNDKFNMVYEFQIGLEKGRPSFVGKSSGEIIFGLRDLKSLENSLRANYNFSTKQGINLSFRNFWSTANFSEDKFSTLQQNGNLQAYNNDDYSEDRNPNANFNIWNLDLSYRWQFAPGSEAVLLYRNSIFNRDALSKLSYRESLDNLFAQPARHNLSLRVVYFVDYNQLKNLFQS
ncbi:DUF5916 domain-containing protein [Gramella sp. AN32]|uniref:DUF5916 domain-containing protein n=1 Tax=Gramella sp. AN32 TaxID=2183748 RepID=UPI00204366C6|nr:DUF5916 domain-containing protein [Gramella sp. AN32]